MLETQRAVRLEDVYKTVSPEPLISRAEFDAFYRPEINALRGYE